MQNNVFDAATSQWFTLGRWQTSMFVVSPVELLYRIHTQQSLGSAPGAGWDPHTAGMRPKQQHHMVAPQPAPWGVPQCHFHTPGHQQAATEVQNTGGRKQQVHQAALTVAQRSNHWQESAPF